MNDAMFRYDSSRLGRFMTADPIAGSPGDPQSLNRYRYVRNDPINLTDPLGLRDPLICLVDPTDASCGGGWGYGGRLWFATQELRWALRRAGLRPANQSNYPRCWVTPNDRVVCGGDFFLPTGWSFPTDPTRAPGGAAANKMVSAAKPPSPPCRIVDPVLGALEFKLKIGPEVQLGPVKAGGSFYKNLTTGGTGATLEANVGLASIQADSPTPDGGSLNSGGPERNQYSTSFLGFQFNFTTGRVSFDPSKSFSLGAQFLLGGEVSLNSDTLLQLDKANAACRAQGEVNLFMKMLLWILLGLVVTGVAFWMVTIPGVPRNPLLMLLIVVVFAVPPFGAFWMLYMSVRHERHPLPMILLAFIPYTFLWYYFERVRHGKHMSGDRFAKHER